MSGSKLLSENLFIAGSYSSVSDNFGDADYKAELKFNRLSFGLGYRHVISSNTDLFTIVSLQEMESEFSLTFGSESEKDNESDNGYGLQAGVRSLVTKNIELSGSLMYTDVGEYSETDFNVSAMYHFTNLFSAGIGYTTMDDNDILNVSTVLFF